MKKLDALLFCSMPWAWIKVIREDGLDGLVSAGASTRVVGGNKPQFAPYRGTLTGTRSK